MPDYAGLCAEWREMLSRRRALGDALSLWTPVLEGWRDWDDRAVAPLTWTGEECRQRWERGVPLLADVWFMGAIEACLQRRALIHQSGRNP